MRTRKRNPGGLRVLALVLVVVMFIATAALCAGSSTDGPAADGVQRAIARGEFAPMAAEGMSQRQAVLPEAEPAVYRGPIQTAAPVIRYLLEDTERDYVERVVMAEAGAEDFDGQCLVAQCILETMLARDMSALDVVREPRQYAAPAAATESVKAAVGAVFMQGYRVTTEPVRYFYAPFYGYSAWHENCLVFVLEHGGHRFFKEG